MRVVIQRCKNAQVTINNVAVSSVQGGMVVLLAVEDTDTQADIDWLTGKIVGLRIFDDENSVMNLNILQTGGDIMVVSQFTLFASTKKGNRPSYLRSSKPDFALPMYERFVASLQKVLGKPVATGRFGADMQVSLCNDGPVTIIIDTKLKE
ncbi:MAG: D-tyrosyl-tRNA(Tyr) deacylase [Bacteroidales bacterium]|nr:D-tyrosyl-tRNA(Tyr) deacylase [Bacteroidales bacterium]MBP3254773.1 D-tyrosyl-tRNA(Tyr) deacylase [Bacteroidales bacterium]